MEIENFLSFKLLFNFLTPYRKNVTPEATAMAGRPILSTRIAVKREGRYMTPINAAADKMNGLAIAVTAFPHLPLIA